MLVLLPGLPVAAQGEHTSCAGFGEDMAHGGQTGVQGEDMVVQASRGPGAVANHIDNLHRGFCAP